MSEQNQVSTNLEQSMSERFMQKVMNEFGSSVGEVALTDFQKRLAQNYFISLDASLRTADEKRIKGNKGKNENYQNLVPITWANVNMELLARNVVSAARIGLDPAQKNHINMVPYKNNATGKYDIGFLEGYRGMELKAKKYALDLPDAVIVELVYSNDKFKSVKKDRNNLIEYYDFEIVNDFDRGHVVGGFYYYIYNDCPEKNKLVVMTMKDIEKRKPQYASVEFWGGEKDVYKDGRKTGEKEKVEGWFEQMCYKTVYRAAYGALTIDSQKIDDDYLQLRQMEQTVTDAKIAAEIAINANNEHIDITHEVITESHTDPEPPKQQSSPEPEPAAPPLKPTGSTGPMF
jgi:recombination protein RecT